jgi:uncharacterized phage protein (TIGR01671 family)
MTTHKYRAWDPEIREMRGVSGIHCGLNAVEFSTDELGTLPHNLDEYELMPYTGFNDRNGREIYEGDIILTTSGVKTVVFSDDIGCFEATDTTGARGLYGYVVNDGVAVISNIYETPDLVRKQFAPVHEE